MPLCRLRLTESITDVGAAPSENESHYIQSNKILSRDYVGFGWLGVAR